MLGNNENFRGEQYILTTTHVCSAKQITCQKKVQNRDCRKPIKNANVTINFSARAHIAKVKRLLNKFNHIKHQKIETLNYHRSAISIICRKWQKIKEKNFESEKLK